MAHTSLHICAVSPEPSLLTNTKYGSRRRLRPNHRPLAQLNMSAWAFKGGLHMFLCDSTVKPVLSGHSKRTPKIGFRYRLSLNASQKYCRMLLWSILQYFRPSLSYYILFRPLFCLFLSGRLRQVLLYQNLVCWLTSCGCTLNERWQTYIQ